MYATEDAQGAAQALDEEVMTDEEAAAELDMLADSSLHTRYLDGRWLAQLSSKSPGTHDPLQVTADGRHIFRSTDILVQVEELMERSDLGEVFVVRSTDYGKRQRHKGQAMWVVFADAGFDSGAGVTSWCRKHFTARGEALVNMCAPRRPRW
ncbi:hypothetical protein [Kineosporia sp. NBRC 101677]|uniref:hypothetical protein n=1 Tax=Kineosporia sp. NBRC 101677 TaxID=3032197 RepID=UPI0025568917|nr:hypothetical protein [Kineosporia sp. NBRC 101677]